MKFDGRALARKIEAELIGTVADLPNKPKIVSFLVPSACSTDSVQAGSGQVDPASVLFTRLKKEAAERVGVGFEVVSCETSELSKKMNEIVGREDVTGIMVQLPIPNITSGELDSVLSLIPKEKDVDGLRYPESRVLPPVVAAVMLILDEIAKTERELWSKRFAVVGARGNVGRVVLEQLVNRGVNVFSVGREQTKEKVAQAEVVISCVGKEGLVNAEMIREGAIIIDVGAPKGDVTSGAYAKAKISVEVPGGVGPVTIACLMKSACSVLGTL